ncbi:MAG: 30S ribosomal protein S7 [Candidatus Hodarchaeota archaeon]
MAKKATEKTKRRGRPRKKEEKQQPKEKTTFIPEIITTPTKPLLFDKWEWEGVEITDEGLKAYIGLKPSLLPHSCGRHEHKRFAKSKMNIVEKLINRIMRTETNTGKKSKTINIVRATFEIIDQKTGQNPIHVLIKAIENAAPREETTRISYGGIIYHQAVDVAPLRRIDISIANITEGAMKTSKNSVKSIEECLADELIAAAQNNAQKSLAIKKKEEKERIALSAR